MLCMTTLPEIVRSASLRIPSKIAVKYKGKNITYQQLYRQINALAINLQQKAHLTKGDRVGVLLKNCPEYIVAYFACLEIGAVVVPLNTFLTAEELLYIFNDCQIKVLITAEMFLPTAKKIQSSYSLPLEIIGGGKKEPGICSWPEMIEPHPINWPMMPGQKDDLAVILYTSGTTGYPKGAMLTHDNLLSNIHSCAKAIELKDSDCFILFLPMFHAFTFTVCVLLPLSIGAKTVILVSVMPFHRVLKSLVVDRITVFVSIPVVYKLLLKAKIPAFFFFWIVPLRLCVSGGAPLPPEVQAGFERRFKIPLLEGYGLSEASPVVTINPLSDVRRPGSIGKPLPGVQVAIVDENGKEVETNEVGEIVIRGSNIMQGYYNAPELTAQTLKGGWLYTGDMGRVNQDGYIYICDRKKDMILVHGMNVYSREVEDVLLSHPEILEVAVIGKKDEHHGEIPVAFVALKENHVVSAKDIINFCRAHLANYKVPRQVRFLRSLPKTATGKISKKELRALL
ncbi:MAG: long-chain fatty acid--CoA ligase [bacterium]|nr:long-chain fatty acid--CoA ligase [bacterium]